MRQRLPFEAHRDKESQLFARLDTHEIPERDVTLPSCIKFPMLLGTFHLDLGQVGWSLEGQFLLIQAIGFPSGSECTGRPSNPLRFVNLIL